MPLKAADSVLAIVSFFVGTIVPVLYRKLMYEGISLKQPFDVRGVFEDHESRNRHQLVFSTVVKLANGTKESLIIDDIQAQSVSTQAAKYDYVGIDLKTTKPGEAFRLPPQTQIDSTLDYLPLLVKDNTESLITIGLWFRYAIASTHDSMLNATDDFMAAVAAEGIAVTFRVNGKYRNYVLRAKPFERWADTNS